MMMSTGSSSSARRLSASDSSTRPLFPSRADALWARAEQAGISRIYGGIHYRFDMDAGLTIARQTAGWALAHDVTGHDPFPVR
jgi:hypothetical protein